MPDLYAHRWGSSGPLVLLVHGSFATGAEEWWAQRDLSEAGCRLVAVDRRGWGQSAVASGEDFVRDGEDIAALMEDGAHLVGHSYGALGTMMAAAARPEATLSLTLLEPPTWTLTDEVAARAMAGAVGALMEDVDLTDEEWVLHFLAAFGTTPATLPVGMLDGLVPLVGLVRGARPPWDHDLPLTDLAAASFPKLVVSGGHHPGWDATCDVLAARIGASRVEIPGAGHEIQFVGTALNRVLLDLWEIDHPAGEPSTGR